MHRYTGGRKVTGNDHSGDSSIKQWPCVSLWTGLSALLLLAVLLPAGLAAAQAAPSAAVPSGTPPADAQTQPGRAGATIAPETEPGPDAAAAPKVRRPGDLIKLKSGGIIEGVQVLKRLPNDYEVEVSEGVTLRLPRSQVESVEYDTIEAADLRRMREEAAKATAARLVPGQKISDITSRLNKDISEPAVEFPNKDLMDILTEMGKRADVDVVAHKSVDGLPPANRTWTFRTRAGQSVTLYEILRDKLPKKFSNLTARYQADGDRLRVLIATVQAAQELEAEGAVAEPESIGSDAKATGSDATATAGQENASATSGAAPKPRVTAPLGAEATPSAAPATPPAAG